MPKKNEEKAVEKKATKLADLPPDEQASDVKGGARGFQRLISAQQGKAED
jgi:hypothetical protein